MVFEFFLRIRRKTRKFIQARLNSGKKLKAGNKRGSLLKAVLVLATIGIITFIYPSSLVYQILQAPREGDIAPEDIISPRNFQVLKSAEEINQEKQLIRASQPLILDYQSKVFDSIRVQLNRFFYGVDSLDQAVLNDSLRLGKFALEFPQLSRESQVTLTSKSNLKTIRKFLIEVLSEIYGSGLAGESDDLPLDRSSIVVVLRDGKEHTFTKEELFDLTRAEEKVLSRTQTTFGRDPQLVKGTYDIARLFLVSNLKFDPKATGRRIDEKLKSISPYKGSVLQGEKIIGKTEKITKGDLEKLVSLAYAQHQPEAAGTLLSYLGRILFVSFVFLFLGLFLYFFKRKTFDSNTKLFMICLIILLEIVSSYVMSFKLGWSEYLIPVTVASLLLTILLDAETGLVCTLCLGLLLGVVYNFDFKLAFLTVAVGVLASFGVKKVQRRSGFYRPMLYISFAYVVFIFFMEYLRYTPTNDILKFCGFGLLNGFFSTVFSIGLLPMFESIFSITTDISLLEFSDLNHPILKRLALEAPGTYHHSIVVGNLAEAAAKEIGANTLLARVGSYYHDIGKIKKPEYFVENQMAAKSKHDKLTPSMSALILESHIKEGAELAEEANLPDAIVDFVEQHHGTSVMTYFYNKALEQGASEGVKNEFCYPGPKPRLRETGIVMLADAVEAASRTLEDAKPSRLKSLIRKMIMEKFESGELDECPLTLKDLHAVEDSFLPILIGVFHPRIDYPETKEDVKTD